MANKVGHKHTHEDSCIHDCLHYCPECKRVFCCECDEEWVKAEYTTSSDFTTKLNENTTLTLN